MKLNDRRRTLTLTLVAALLAGLPVSAAWSQAAFPNQPITVIVPFSPGGNLDMTARIVTGAMQQSLGQTFVIDNRAGAGGVIGHQVGSRAPANGYTLTMTATGSLIYTPRLQAGKRPFMTADFAPVGMAAITPLVLEVPAGGRFKDIQSLLAFAKANPGQVTVGHSGNGTSNHISILELQDAAGVQFNIVPYKGSGPALTDLLGGQIDAIVDQLLSSMSYLQTGKLRGLAVTTATRAADLPNVPTLAESGFKDFDVSTSAGLLAPAKTPEPVLQALNKALNDALNDPAVKKRLHELGAEAKPMSMADYKRYLATQEAEADALIKKGSLKPE